MSLSQEDESTDFVGNFSYFVKDSRDFASSFGELSSADNEVLAETKYKHGT